MGASNSAEYEKISVSDVIDFLRKLAEDECLKVVTSKVDNSGSWLVPVVFGALVGPIGAIAGASYAMNSKPKYKKYPIHRAIETLNDSEKEELAKNVINIMKYVGVPKVDVFAQKVANKVSLKRKVVRVLFDFSWSEDRFFKN